MRPTKRRVAGALAVLTSAGLLVAACGGSSETTGPGGAQVQVPAQATTGQETAPILEEPAVAATSDTASAQLRATLNALLAEHAQLAAGATGAALGGRQDEFEAAAAALDANSVALADLIGSAYGSENRESFLNVWRSHIGFVVDYTTGLATNDQMKADRAVQDLLGYTQAFGQELNRINENLPTDAVAELVEMHILSLKDVIDAQAAGNQQQAYTLPREAAGHMSMIADPLAAATVTKFSDQFDA